MDYNVLRSQLIEESSLNPKPISAKLITAEVTVEQRVARTEFCRKIEIVYSDGSVKTYSNPEWYLLDFLHWTDEAINLLQGE